MGNKTSILTGTDYRQQSLALKQSTGIEEINRTLNNNSDEVLRENIDKNLLLQLAGDAMKGPLY